MNDIFDMEKLGKKSLQNAILSGLGGLIVLMALAYSAYKLNWIENELSKKKIEIHTLNVEVDKAQKDLTKAKSEQEKVDAEKKQAAESLANLRKEIDTNNLELNKLKKDLQEAKEQLPLGASSKVLDSAISSTQQIELRMGVAAESAKDVYKEKLYYVISMTSSTREDIENEINRVKKKVGTTFEEQFPNIEPYAPEGGLWTLLISGKSLPSAEANDLKQRAIKAGFSKDTWLWQSGVEYFSSKKQ